MEYKLPIDRVVYAGTFDPITNGHLDIVERATRLFSKVIVAVARSTSKSTLFTTDECVAMAKEATAHLGDKVEVVEFDGLLVEFVKRIGARLIVRGLRAVSDYEYEAQLAATNRRLAEDVEIIYLMTSEHCSFISASMVRDIAKHKGDVSKFVPAIVAPRLVKKFS